MQSIHILKVILNSGAECKGARVIRVSYYDRDHNITHSEGQLGKKARYR